MADVIMFLTYAAIVGVIVFFGKVIAMLFHRETKDISQFIGAIVICLLAAVFFSQLQ